MPGGFLPLPNGFLPAQQRNGFVPPSTLVAAVDPMAGVTRDAASGIYTPASAAEWTTTLAAAGLNTTTFAPSALWLLQEASGNPADSIGAFTLTASGTPSYRQAVTGWTRLAITFSDAASGALAAVTPDIATTDVLTLAYVKFPAAAPAGTRQCINQGATATRCAAEVIATTGVLRGRHNTNTADTTSTCDGNVHLVVVQSDRTNSLATICTEALKTNPVFSAAAAGTGTRLGAASAGNTMFAGGFLYAVNFHGAAARMSDAQKKTLAQTLGYSVAW